MIIVSEKRATGPMWSESGGDLYDRADGSGPSGSKALDPLPNSPNTEWRKLTKSPSAPSLQFASPSRPYTAFSPSLEVGGKPVSTLAWNTAKVHPEASSSTNEITLATPSPEHKSGSPDTYYPYQGSLSSRMRYLNRVASQRLASDSPPKGFTSNAKKFFSKLKGKFNNFKGKLSFRPRFHWQRTTVDTGA